jgi:putative tricarboxylic transport membrane protein
MIDLSALGTAIATLTGGFTAWIWVIPGLLIGCVFGALPGISITMAMALFLPMTLYMEFLPAIIFLTSIFTGAGFGGSVPAVLMNIPGTTSAVATTFDGYPMARKGLHNEALGAALGASVTGALISYIVLLFLILPLANVVIKMGPLEMLGIAVWGLLMLGSLTGVSLLRGLIAGFLGVLIGTVGMNTAGYMRGTMGIPELLDGVSPVPALMGLLAASALFSLVNSKFIVENDAGRGLSAKRLMSGFFSILKHKVCQIRGTLIGILIGATPGVGSSVANLMSYSEAKRTAQDPDSFGKGNVEGVIAAESANSSSEGGSMATMLALGIPGGGATAVLLAAFALHNVVGGPNFIDKSKDVVYTIILSNVGQCLLLFPVGFLFIYFASYLVKVPLRFLIPVVLTASVFGAYALSGSAAGPATLLFFAVLGWVLSRYKYPPAAVVVGMLLGGLVENEALKTMQISDGHAGYIFERPGAIAIFFFMLLSLALTARVRLKKAKERKLREQQAASTS